MSSKREFVDYVQDILDAISYIEKFTEGMNYQRFSADAKTVFAVTRAFEIIGEAVKKIPVSVRSQYSQMPWREIAGIRDKLIHEYFGVDTEVVWKTIQKDLPELRLVVKDILKNLKSY